MAAGSACFLLCEAFGDWRQDCVCECVLWCSCLTKRELVCVLVLDYILSVSVCADFCMCVAEQQNPGCHSAAH